MDRIVKQESEIFPISVDFSDALASGETISSGDSSIKVYDDTDSDVTSTIIVSGSISYATEVVTFKVQNGTDGKKYKITVKIKTGNNNIFEKDINLYINNQ